MAMTVKRIVLGSFAFLFFALAAYEFRRTGMTSQVAFPGLAAVLLAWASITGKG